MTLKKDVCRTSEYRPSPETDVHKTPRMRFLKSEEAAGAEGHPWCKKRESLYLPSAAAIGVCPSLHHTHRTYSKVLMPYALFWRKKSYTRFSDPKLRYPILKVIWVVSDSRKLSRELDFGFLGGGRYRI